MGLTVAATVVAARERGVRAIGRGAKSRAAPLGAERPEPLPRHQLGIVARASVTVIGHAARSRRPCPTTRGYGSRGTPNIASSIGRRRWTWPLIPMIASL